ncbi:hypothetical protein VRRI112168_02380 [Vreelandella rituensis]|uniref:Uncharacterized protein n=1 Tax=Vreelandella rituensis TaxID=2282306 RepID=A0A368U9I6_9GAMM|nr:hypothetical protein [Halomonas rituensis]RCV93594.1 hypothetical protein DU506_00120 [Halomonas rituensis]
MRETAAKLDRMATDLEENNDWDAASGALNAVPNLRLDLLAARPIREFQYQVAELENRLSASSDAESQ